MEPERTLRTKSQPGLSTSSLAHLIKEDTSRTPTGVWLFGLCFKFTSSGRKRTFHKALMLFMTFVAYAAFHMGRRPLSVVKNVLNQNCDSHTNATISEDGSQVAPGPATCNDWAPFDDNATANQLLAYLDTAFLLSYAVFMFFSGIIAERMNLRYLISVGSILSGLGLIAFGLAYPLDIHSMSYFVAIQIVSGAAQTIGWPVVVTCVSNWFEESKRGTIYGLWNSHTSLGNILGATIAGFFVEKNWGLSFDVPGVIMIVVGVLLFLFLVPGPTDVGLSKPNSNDFDDEHPSQYDFDQLTIDTSVKPAVIDYQTKQTQRADESTNKADDETTATGAVSFCDALKIPGVIEYSFCLFFSKLVSYTFLYWLPRYITSSTTFNSEDSAYLSTPFDVGGIAGAIMAGYLSDKLRANGLICNVMLLLAIPSMYCYQHFGSQSKWNNILLQLVVGALVNGPYCLITTAVSADLGTRVTDGHAMATVSAIIDGMGSMGAVIGPLFAGFVSASDWQNVFLMLMLADVLASLCIIRITISDFKKKFSSRSF